MKQPLPNIERILIINLAFIGDVLLSTPVARALKAQYPQASIDMLVVPVAEPIAAVNPYIDHTIIYDKKGRHKKFTEAAALVRDLRRRRYDLAVCTNFALRGALVAWLSGIPLRAGYDIQMAGMFLTHRASTVRQELRHEAENYLAVLHPLGITTTDTSLALEIPEKIQGYARRVLGENGELPLVLICPYGSYERKSWADRDYVELLKQIKSHCHCYLIGGAAEAVRLKSLQQAAGLSERQVLAGTANLVELAALLQDAAALITVDTGPLHIAQAVKTPVIALFGPTDPVVWGPRGACDTVFYRKTACSPCWGKGECPEHICLQPAEISGVVQALFRLLEVK